MEFQMKHSSEWNQDLKLNYDNNFSKILTFKVSSGTFFCLYLHIIKLKQNEETNN
jgi:hypothetical protein